MKPSSIERAFVLEIFVKPAVFLVLAIPYHAAASAQTNFVLTLKTALKNGYQITLDPVNTNCRVQNMPASVTVNPGETKRYTVFLDNCSGVNYQIAWKVAFQNSLGLQDLNPYWKYIIYNKDGKRRLLFDNAFGASSGNRGYYSGSFYLIRATCGPKDLLCTGQGGWVDANPNLTVVPMYTASIVRATDPCANFSTRLTHQLSCSKKGN